MKFVFVARLRPGFHAHLIDGFGIQAADFRGFGRAAEAPLLDGQLVGYDGGDGIASPTPVRLVQVAEYLKSIQE